MPGFILDGDPIIYDGKDFSPTDSILDWRHRTTILLYKYRRRMHNK
jgi:hypothetical protein